MSILNEFETDFDKVRAVQNILIDCATGGDRSKEDYSILRQNLILKNEIKLRLPDFVIHCRDLKQFWIYIKPKFSTYDERRNFLFAEFQALLNYLEGLEQPPSTITISDTLRSFDEQGIHELWQKALERKLLDPEGAITVARSLVESVCKHILDHQNVSYENKSDLSKLYKSVAKNLNLSPSQHKEQLFMQILTGCSSIVDGLCALRNEFSDAHGKGIELREKKRIKPAPRHAELAINIAGTMALFLITTYQEKGGI